MAEDCPFCQLVVRGNWFLGGTRVVAIADAFPVSPGHALVIPRRHEPDFLALDAEESSEMWSLGRKVCDLLGERHKPDGFNLGVNVGPAAGQTVAHAHLHVIPRYAGDVPDPRGGIRWILAERARSWNG